MIFLIHCTVERQTDRQTLLKFTSWCCRRVIAWLLASLRFFPCQEIENGRLALIEGDITRVNLRQIFGSDPQRRTSQKVVANLPFNITTDVLKLLLPLGDVISEVFVMLQVRPINEVIIELMDVDRKQIHRKGLRTFWFNHESETNMHWGCLAFLLYYYISAISKQRVHLWPQASFASDRPEFISAVLHGSIGRHSLAINVAMNKDSWAQHQICLTATYWMPLLQWYGELLFEIWRLQDSEAMWFLCNGRESVVASRVLYNSFAAWLLHSDLETDPESLLPEVWQSCLLCSLRQPSVCVGRIVGTLTTEQWVY